MNRCLEFDPPPAFSQAHCLQNWHVAQRSQQNSTTKQYEWHPHTSSLHADPQHRRSGGTSDDPCCWRPLFLHQLGPGASQASAALQTGDIAGFFMYLKFVFYISNTAHRIQLPNHSFRFAF